MKPARIIVSDPPWFYGNRREYRLDNPKKKSKAGVGAAGKYTRGVMKTAEMVRFGPYIQAVCTDDAYHFMWTTGTHLAEAIWLLEYWGFEYITIAGNWVKVYDEQKPLTVENCVKGMGAYIPANTELVLLGRNKRERLWHKNTGKKPCQIIASTCNPDFREEFGTFAELIQGLVIVNERLEHSQKPEAFQDGLDAWLDKWIGDYSKLELFARRHRPGWICLGDVLSGQDLAHDLDDLAYEMGREVILPC